MRDAERGASGLLSERWYDHRTGSRRRGRLRLLTACGPSSLAGYIERAVLERPPLPFFAMRDESSEHRGRGMYKTRVRK